MQDLIAKHEKAFTDIKAYYVDITATNLDMIKALKEQTAELRTRELAAAKALAEKCAQNRRLVEPFEQVNGTTLCYAQGLLRMWACSGAC